MQSFHHKATKPNSTLQETTDPRMRTKSMEWQRVIQVDDDEEPLQAPHDQETTKIAQKRSKLLPLTTNQTSAASPEESIDPKRASKIRVVAHALELSRTERLEGDEAPRPQ
jgi:hypothetical protein